MSLNNYKQHDCMQSHYLKDPLEIDENEIRQKNPWCEVADQYIGNEFLFADEDKKFVCHADLSTIESFNAKVKEEHQYKLNVPVYPWLGNPLEAKVILLTLNPGLVDREVKFGRILSQLPPSLVEGYAVHARETLRLNSSGLFPENFGCNGLTYRDLANMHGSYYWQDRINNAFFDPQIKGLDMEQINRNLAIMQLVGYSSKHFKPFYKGQSLPSQIYTQNLIEFIYQHNKNVVFLILRSASEWKKLEVIKNGEKERVFDIHNRAQSFSKNVLKDELFQRVVSLLKQ